MKIYLHGEKIKDKAPSVALGNFDGVHKGHIKVISAAKEKGESYGALLFRVHSSAILGNKVKIITPLYKKIRIMKELGVDFVYLVDFDEKFMNMTCAEFAEFIDNIGAKSVSVGYDFRCGKGAKANCEDLREELAPYGIDVIISQPVTADGEPIKSTLLRKLFSEGKVSSANSMMGRRYSMRGKVVKGLQNGKLLGFPTANIEISAEELILKDGVYYTTAFINGKEYPSMSNIGNNPTFDAEKKTVEVHIIGYSDNLYDDYLEIEFVDYIRPDIKFDSIDMLVSQLEQDKEEVLRRHKKEV